MKDSNYITCDEVTREQTPEGYLRVSVRAGRSGIQRYSCENIGVPDVLGTGFVNVLRHPDDVFEQTSLDSLMGKDVTVLHPKENRGLVDSQNFKRLSKGTILSSGKRIDDDIYLDAIIKDSGAIESLDGGLSSASLGYTNDYLREDGDWMGESYQYRQKSIFYNHLALVPKGRAGSRYVVLDEEETFMNEEEKQQFRAEIVQDVLAALTTIQTPNNVTHDEMDKMLLERSNIIDKAKQINPNIDFSNKSNIQIMRESLGSKVTLDHDDNIVKYAFDSLEVQVKDSPRQKLNLASPASQGVVTHDAHEIQSNAHERFKQSTSRGFASLVEQLRGAK